MQQHFKVQSLVEDLKSDFSQPQLSALTTTPWVIPLSGGKFVLNAPLPTKMCKPKESKFDIYESDNIYSEY